MRARRGSVRHASRVREGRPAHPADEVVPGRGGPSRRAIAGPPRSSPRGLCELGYWWLVADRCGPYLLPRSAEVDIMGMPNRPDRIGFSHVG
ncbi:MAG: hypothetical protein AVDCRST_MAG06-1180 [uncultured Nocardioides sp.]|uniref:Uncharacterized protein n=1 Tax=uncultured Nocardioides sp. TaxID=198441 RepID=A0A6J4NJA9_9ACTN|nr:MAG: hypothetical protein AVDCRST_MAG06-1180 [uncultured Nocardioides sp.]